MTQATFDLVVGNARLADRGETLVHVGIRGDRIAAVSSEGLPGRAEIDAGGGLVSPAFVDAHLHLCKVYTLPLLGDQALRRYTSGGMGQAMNAIELAAAVKSRYEEGWIYENARRALLEGLRHGVLHVQAFVDTDTKARLEGVKGVLRARDELGGIVDVRVVAFPQDGLLRDPGAEGYLRQALELGADVVGGIPWIEYTDAEAAEHVERVFGLAREFDRDVAMLVDDAGDATLRTTELLAAAALRHGWSGRVTACHARAMALYPEPYFRRLVGLARRAGIGFVTDPHTGPLHLRAFDLMEAGVPVALGQDDIADAYYAFGEHNLLEVAFLAAHILNASPLTQADALLGMVTQQAARIMRLPDYGLAPGCAANLVVLEGSSPYEAIWRHRPPRYVISRGRLVVTNESSTRFDGVPGA